MNRRFFLAGLGIAATLPLTGRALLASEEEKSVGQWPLMLSDEQWRARLDALQYQILRNEATERPYSSPLLSEKRAGLFACVGCDQPLFSAATKYDSRTGWPSFFSALDGAVGTKTDFKLILPRTEYHCSRCGGHHGHIFKDGPKPTGLRYCNNGAVLKFAPA